MNSKVLWNDQVPLRDGQKSSINDIAISPGKIDIIIFNNNSF